jgi:transcriptional antiterminator RfaH
MNMSFGPRWYVARTQVHAENKAAAHLVRQGFQIYLPRHLKRRRHARRVDTVAAPLFPGYLFVAFDIAVQRWRSILSTVGVSGLIFNGDGPAAIATSVIDGLRSNEDNGFIRLPAKPSYMPGDKVRVEEGVFRSSFGLFDGMTSEERIVVLLDLLGRKVRVTLDAEFVSAA